MALRIIWNCMPVWHVHSIDISTEAAVHVNLQRLNGSNCPHKSTAMVPLYRHIFCTCVVSCLHTEIYGNRCNHFVANSEVEVLTSRGSARN